MDDTARRTWGRVALASGLALAAFTVMQATSAAHAAPSTPAAPQQAGTSSTTPEPAAATTCPSAVTITAIAIRPELVNGQVVVDITHDGQGCPAAAPALLHVHENLSATPSAGSDPAHQSNLDLPIGPNFGSTVTVPLLSAVAVECFVQVDVSADGIRRGRFFPTTTCPSATTATTASTSPPPTSPTSAPPPAATTAAVASHAVAAASTRRRPATASAPAGSTSTLAATGVTAAVELAIAAGLLLAGGWLCLHTRRPRHN